MPRLFTVRSSLQRLQRFDSRTHALASIETLLLRLIGHKQASQVTYHFAKPTHLVAVPVHMLAISYVHRDLGMRLGIVVRAAPALASGAELRAGRHGSRPGPPLILTSLTHS